MAEGTKSALNNSTDLVLFVWRQRRMIIRITLLGIIVGVVTAFVLRPRYKSVATVFPTVSNSISHSMLNEYSGGREDILGLGDEEDAEHLIQMLSSTWIRDRLADKYDLWKAYRIKPDDKHRRFHMAEAYTENVSVQYTRYGSVEVQVTDEDPERAAGMANDVVDLMDSVWFRMEQERARPALALLDREVSEQGAVIEGLQDTLRTMQRAGVNDYRSQSERFNAELAKAIGRGDDRAVKALEQRLASTAEAASRYMTLDQYLGKSTERLATLNTLRLRMQADLRNNLPRKLVVDRAQVPDKRVYPVRWLIVVISTACAFFLAIVLIIVRENIQRIRASNG